MKRLRFGHILKSIILLLLVIGFYQCMQDEYQFDKLDPDINVNARFTTPLVYGSLNLENLVSQLDSSGVNIGDDNLIYLSYEDSLFSFIADDLLEVPNQDFVEFFIDNHFGIVGTGWGSAVLDTTDYFPFSFENNEKLDSIVLDTGDIVFDIRFDFACTGIIQMEFPTIQLNGVPLTPDPIAITNPSGTFTDHIEISIDNYTVILSDAQALPAVFHIELYDEGNLIQANDSIIITAGIQNIDFDAVFGFIGDYELITETGELDLGFFDNPLDGDITFANPQIEFFIDNSYGVPAEVTIDRFTALKGENDSIQMTFDPSVNPFNYAYPTVADYVMNPVDFAQDTTISINGTNSNISDLISLLPESIAYSLKASSNPGAAGGDTLYNFVTDNSSIDVNFRFLLPMQFTSDLAYVDTVDVDLSDIPDEVELIERLELELEVTNGLPTDIDFQLVFVDSLYNEVDSLFVEGDQPIIPSGETELDYSFDPPGLDVVSPTTEKTKIVYTGDEILNLEGVKYGIVKVRLKTTGTDPVLFKADAKISYKVKVTAIVNGEYNFD